MSIIRQLERQAARFGSMPIECPDGFGICGGGGGGGYGGGGYSGGGGYNWYFDIGGNPYYFGGYNGGNNSIGNGASVPCNCLHGAPYTENGVCKCCDGVVINNSCTGGIKSPPAPSAEIECLNRNLTAKGISYSWNDATETCIATGANVPTITPAPVTPSASNGLQSFFDLIKANPIPSAAIGIGLLYAFSGSGNSGSKK